MSSLIGGMRGFAAERATLVQRLGRVRWVSAILGIGNLAAIFLGMYLAAAVISPACAGGARLAVLVVAAVSGARIASMVRAGMAQQATAETILGGGGDGAMAAVDTVVRHERRIRYRRWLWWTRIGMAVTVLQFVAALYLMFVIVSDFSYYGRGKDCFVGQDTESRGQMQILVALFAVLVWLVVIIQCFTGSDVLRWRSFYATHDTAWKAHYQEVFDHGIREALCCLGRVKYLSVLEEDEVHSVARLLGDLVAYRASGTGHLELLAGLALLQRNSQSLNSSRIDCMEAPETRIREAALLHQFAEAAYTGPLLDFGRNPVLFPCAWLHRQGILSPWSRTRRPILEGDNWWRGHAAAFLKYVNLSPESLRRGRVSQTKREAAYFVVVLHDKKCIVIAVRGTETPEDLLTDGLCRECPLSMEDLDGLINNEHLLSSVKQKVLSSFPHYGHSGIVESAHELYMQLDGQPGGNYDLPSERSGFLSSLLGEGCECHGYEVRIVGHSLGGAVATLLGLRLLRRYPNLHVYSYGSLPCLDSVIAEACSAFVTTVVYNDEFSARLSINSILRLRAAAITALSDDSSADSAMIIKLARKFLNGNKDHENVDCHSAPAPSCETNASTFEDGNHIHKRRPLKYSIKGGVFVCGHAVLCMMSMPTHRPCSPLKDDCKLSSGVSSETTSLYDNESYTFNAGNGHGVQEVYREEAPFADDSNSEILKGAYNGHGNSRVSKSGICGCGTSDSMCFESSDHLIPMADQDSRFVYDTPSSIEVSGGETTELYLPGLIVHIVPERRSVVSLWRGWNINGREAGYKAFVAQRENFKDIVVTPYMFLDHLPWRCHYAMQRVLETQKSQGQHISQAEPNADLFDGENIV